MTQSSCMMMRLRLRWGIGMYMNVSYCTYCSRQDNADSGRLLDTT